MSTLLKPVYSSNAPQGSGTKQEVITDGNEGKDPNNNIVWNISQIEGEYEPGRKDISSYYNHKFITEGLRVPWLIVVNDGKVRQRIEQIFRYQGVSATNFKIPTAKNFSEAEKFFTEDFEYKVLGDLEFLEQLLKTQDFGNKKPSAQSSFIEKISQIHVYNNDMKSGEARCNKLREICSKITKMVYSTKEVEDSIKAELNYHRVNVEIREGVIQSISNKADPVHPAYIYVGWDKPISQIQHQEKFPFRDDKSELTNFLLFLEATSKLITLKEEPRQRIRQRKQYLWGFEAFFTKYYHQNLQNQWDVEFQKFKNYIAMIQPLDFDPQNQEWCTKLLAFYKLPSFFYKCLNTLTRISSKVDDFRFIALPLSQIQQSIEFFYKKYPNKTKKTIYRSCLMPFRQHLKPGMYLCSKNPWSFTTDKEKLKDFAMVSKERDDCYLEMEIDPGRESSTDYQSHMDFGLIANKPQFIDVIKKNCIQVFSVTENEITVKKAKQLDEKQCQYNLDKLKAEKQIIFQAGLYVKIEEIDNTADIPIIKLNLYAIHELEHRFRLARKSLTLEEESIIINYQMIKNKKLNMKDAGDMYRQAEDYQKWLDFREKAHKTHPSNQNAIKLIEARQAKGDPKLSYELNKELINSLQNKIPQIVKDQTLREKFLAILRHNEDAFKVQQVLQAHIQQLQHTPDRHFDHQLQISKILYELSDVCFSDQMYEKSKVALEKCEKILKVLDKENKNSNIFHKLSSTVSGLFKSRQAPQRLNKTADTNVIQGEDPGQQNLSIAMTAEESLNKQRRKIVTQLLVKVQKALIKLYKTMSINMKEAVKMHESLLEKYLGEYNELIGGSDQKSPEMIIIEMQLLLKSRDTRSYQEQSKLIEEKLKEAKKANPYSEEVLNLSIIQVDTGKKLLFELANEPNEAFETQEITNPDMNNCFNQISQDCCDSLFKCLKGKNNTSYNYENRETIIKTVSESYEDKIKAHQKTKGANAIQTVTSRTQYAEFAQSVHLLTKSTEQALLVLKSQLCKIHTTGCKAHLLLSQNFFQVGEYVKSYSVLEEAVAILQRVKIKIKIQEYERSLNTSELHIDLTVMKVKLENKRVELYVEEMVRGRTSLTRQDFSLFMLGKKDQVTDTIVLLSKLEKDSECTQITNVTNYLKIREQLALTFNVFNLVLFKITLPDRKQLLNASNPVQTVPKSSNTLLMKESLMARHLPLDFIHELKMIKDLIKKQKGVYNMDSVINCATTSKLTISAEVPKQLQIIKLKQGENYLKKAFSIASVFPYDHPNNFMLFLLKFEIHYRNQLVGKSQSPVDFTLLDYAVQLAQKRFKDPTLKSISLIMLQCQTLLKHKFSSQALQVQVDSDVQKKLRELQVILSVQSLNINESQLEKTHAQLFSNLSRPNSNFTHANPQTAGRPQKQLASLEVSQPVNAQSIDFIVAGQRPETRQNEPKVETNPAQQQQQQQVNQRSPQQQSSPKDLIESEFDKNWKNQKVKMKAQVLKLLALVEKRIEQQRGGQERIGGQEKMGTSESNPIQSLVNINYSSSNNSSNIKSFLRSNQVAPIHKSDQQGFGDASMKHKTDQRSETQAKKKGISLKSNLKPINQKQDINSSLSNFGLQQQ